MPLSFFDLLDAGLTHAALYPDSFEEGLEQAA